MDNEFRSAGIKLEELPSVRPAAGTWVFRIGTKSHQRRVHGGLVRSHRLSHCRKKIHPPAISPLTRVSIFLVFLGFAALFAFNLDPKPVMAVVAVLVVAALFLFAHLAMLLVPRRRGWTNGISQLGLPFLATYFAVFAYITRLQPGLAAAKSLAQITKDTLNVRTIIFCCREYASKHDGQFPNLDKQGNRFNNSTDVFNILIRETGVSEEMFYVPGNPSKRIPNMDGILQPEENCYVYVCGQYDTMNPNSPLVADEMVAPGVYGDRHPWLNDGVAVVGFIGLDVRVMKLDSRLAPARVKGPPGSGIEDIFVKSSRDDEGRVLGGLMEVDRENILFP